MQFWSGYFKGFVHMLPTLPVPILTLECQFIPKISIGPKIKIIRQATKLNFEKNFQRES